MLTIENREKVFGVVHGKIQDGKIISYEYWDIGILEAYKEANKRLLDISAERMIE